MGWLSFIPVNIIIILIPFQLDSLKQLSFDADSQSQTLQGKFRERPYSQKQRYSKMEHSIVLF